jgi:hypothetical protein
MNALLSGQITGWACTHLKAPNLSIVLFSWSLSHCPSLSPLILSLTTHYTSLPSDPQDTTEQAGRPPALGEGAGWASATCIRPEHDQRPESGPGERRHGAGRAAAGAWGGRRRGSRTCVRPEHDQRPEDGRRRESGPGERRHGAGRVAAGASRERRRGLRAGGSRRAGGRPEWGNFTGSGRPRQSSWASGRWRKLGWKQTSCRRWCSQSLRSESAAGNLGGCRGGTAEPDAGTRWGRMRGVGAQLQRVPYPRSSPTPVVPTYICSYCNWEDSKVNPVFLLILASLR